MLRLTPTAPLSRASRAPSPPSSPRLRAFARLPPHPATSSPLSQTRTCVTHCAWYPADTGVSCVRGFPNYCFFFLQTVSLRKLWPPAFTFFSPSSSCCRVSKYIYTCVYIFCALPLDVPLGRSASCVLLLTNVQSARAVKTPRFAGTPVHSSHFLSLSLFFFQFSPEAVGIIFFFRPTYLFIRFIPFFSGNASYTFCVFAFILFSSASRHRHRRHCC